MMGTALPVEVTANGSLIVLLQKRARSVNRTGLGLLD